MNPHKLNSSNGRINITIKEPDTQQLFALYDKIPANQCVGFRETYLSQWDETVLTKAFFSKENMQILHNGIRAGVYEKSKHQYIIGPQDWDSLTIIMRSVFLQHSANRPDNITRQIEELNKIVLDYCIFHVYSEAQSYMKYLQDVSTLPVPLATPVMEVQKDKNNYRMPTWL
jgi:hypothetical protein